MRYITTVVLVVCFLLGSASAQVTFLPEREILNHGVSVFSSGGERELERAKCGNYFLYFGADSAVPVIVVSLKTLPSDGQDRYFLIMMQKRNVEVRIDSKKIVPTAEALPGPKFIIRINRLDYLNASWCLPKPLGA